MAIAVAGDDDEENHRSQPPMKKQGTLGSLSARSAIALQARRHKQTDQCQNCYNRRKARSRDSPKNARIPRETFDPDSASAEEMVRIKVRSDLIGVPVPGNRRQQRDTGEKSDR